MVGRCLTPMPTRQKTRDMRDKEYVEAVAFYIFKITNCEFVNRDVLVAASALLGILLVPNLDARDQQPNYIPHVIPYRSGNAVYFPKAVPEK